MNSELGVCAALNQLDLQGLGLETEVNDVGNNQPCLPNEASIKSLNIKARVSILVWQHFTHILLHFNARRVIYPLGLRCFVFRTLLPDPYMSCVCFYAISFCHNKTNGKYSPILGSVRKIVKCESGQENPKFIVSWFELRVAPNSQVPTDL